MRKFISCVSALAVIAATSAPAMAAVVDVPSVTAAAASTATQTAMTSQCNALAAALAVGNTDRWTADVVEGDVTQTSGPTEIGTHTFDANGVGDREGAGTFTAAHLEILGDPFRNGGSVNMFGIQQSVGGHYRASSYDFSNYFASSFDHAFSCEIYQEVYHPAVTLHHPAVGIYVVDPDANGNEEAKQQSCAAFTAMQPEDPLTGMLTPPWWGQPQGQCLFEGAAAYDETIPAHYDAPELYDTVAGTPVPQSQTDELTAHEDFGEGYDTSETLIIGQAVVCISPSTTSKKTLPGSGWAAKSPYDGSKCTTEWYNGGAKAGVPNLNDGSHNFVTVPVV
jgi:hypothetical protein